MTRRIVVPRLGWSMEQGVFLGWLKRDGEAVQAGEPLFKLEGDKAEQEVEAVESGILRVAPEGPAVGDVVAVGTVLGHFVVSAERGVEVPDLSTEAKRVPRADTLPVEGAAQWQDRKLASTGRNPSPARRGPEGQDLDQRPITPRARRAARELGIDPAKVRGTGRNGRVRERDVLAQSAQAKVPGVSPARRTIAERMLHSQRTTAPVTLTTKADATNLANLRGQFQKVAAGTGGVVPSYTDFLVKIAALALRQHPLLASRWEEKQAVLPSEIHIGIAVDTDAGLLVPVVRDVPSLPLRQLAQRTRELAEKARQRRLTPAEMQGGTFTVTNLGAFGIDAFTPIINWPECAILGVGRVQRRPAIVNDQIVPRDQVTLSLTFDHRIVDGAPAARFLQTLCQGVENPSAWLVD